MSVRRHPSTPSASPVARGRSWLRQRRAIRRRPAAATASAREWTSSFRMMLLRWERTVAGESTSASATSSGEWPGVRRSMTSHSRAVSGTLDRSQPRRAVRRSAESFDQTPRHLARDRRFAPAHTCTSCGLPAGPSPGRPPARARASCRRSRARGPVRQRPRAVEQHAHEPQRKPDGRTLRGASSRRTSGSRRCRASLPACAAEG